MSYIKTIFSYSDFNNGYENTTIPDYKTFQTDKKPYKFNSAEKSLKKLFEIVVLKNIHDVSNEFAGAEIIYTKFSDKVNEAISEQVSVLNSEKANGFSKYVAQLSIERMLNKLEQVKKYYIPLKYLKGENLNEDEKLRLESFKKELSFKKKVLKIAKIATLILIGVGAASIACSIATGNIFGILGSGALIFSPMTINEYLHERLDFVRSAIKILKQTNIPLVEKALNY